MNVAWRVVEDAVALQNAGCFAIVVEAVPSPVADIVRRAVHVPTIGIGAGAGTSGQVLVQSDIVGSYDRFVPKYVIYVIGKYI